MNGEWIRLTAAQRIELEKKALDAGYERVGDFMLNYALNSDAGWSAQGKTSSSSLPLPVINDDKSTQGGMSPVKPDPLDTLRGHGVDYDKSVDIQEYSPSAQKQKKYYGLADKYVGFDVIGPKGEIPSNHYSFEIVDFSLTRNSNIGEIPYHQGSSDPNKRTAFNFEMAAKIIYAEGNPGMLGKILMQHWFFGDHAYSYNKQCARMAALLSVAGVKGVPDAPNYTFDGLSSVNLMSIVGKRLDTHIEISGKPGGDRTIFMSSIEPCTFHRD